MTQKDDTKSLKCIMEDLDKEHANTNINICDYCGKKIRWWQYNGDYFSGIYHVKCYNKKFKK